MSVDVVFEYIKRNLLIVFIAIFVFFYISCVQRQLVTSFFIFLLILFGIYMSLQYINVQTNQNKSVISTVDFLEKEMHDFQKDIDNRNIYTIYKPPQSLKFIRRNDVAQKILHDLKPLVSIDKNSTISIIIHLEYFLKYHFYIMTERYKDIDIYLPILQDIRKELLNLCKGVVMSDAIPEYFDKTFTLIQNFTYEYIVVLKRKFNVRNRDIYNMPRGVIESKDESTSFY